MTIKKKLPDGVSSGEIQGWLGKQSVDEGWRRYHCKLVTPMYGGGVEAGKVDAEIPIRATAIRGQLRFWWRIAYRQEFIREGKLDHQAMFRRERELWGGLGGADELAASKVMVRLLGTVENALFEPCAKYDRRDDGTYKTMPNWAPWADGYALFPAQGKASRSGVELPPSKLLKPGAEWQMAINVPDLNETDSREVSTALRWWASFGGVGARTRRGLGAVEIKLLDSDEAWPQITTITQQEAKDAGVTLVFRGNPTDKPLDAWKNAINAMRLFRQGKGIGRNPGQEQNRPGRSRWPEPDAIRRHTNTHAPLHQPAHPAGQLFPRAAFGLPIIFHFKDRGDPADATLSPIDKERMASPLILRPYLQANGLWRSAALRLPYGHVSAMNLRLAVKGMDASLNLPSGVWWPSINNEEKRKSVATAVSPIRLTGTPTEPLSAFMVFFQKPDLANGDAQS